MAIKRPSALCLMGPTASGKTDLAVALAEVLPIQIISVDSALVYREMNIGTAKPDAQTLKKAPHALIDLIDPTETYSAAQFCREATAAIQASFEAHRLPVLVGGTMLYFNALFKGLSDLPEGDPTIRAALEAEAQEKGWPALHARLATLDPITAARLAPNDAQRIERALEICLLTGRPMSALLEESRPQTTYPWNFYRITLEPTDRAVLHQRIADRFEGMLQAGLIEEVEGLRRDYPHLTADHPSMRAVGYRQTWSFLEAEEGFLTHTALKERGIIATRQLAKRQLTWLRSMEADLRLPCDTPHLKKDFLAQVLSAFPPSL